MEIMKKIVFEKAPTELKFVGVENPEQESHWKAIVVKDHDREKYRLINLAENENLPSWTEKTLNEIISESKIYRCHTYSFASNTDLVSWAMGDDSVQKFPISDTTETIHIDDVTDEMFVGIVWNSGDKAFVTKIESGFISKSLKLILNADLACRKSIKSYLKDCNLKSAHVFPTAKELLQWTIAD